MRDPMLVISYLLGSAMLVTGLLILGGVLRAPEQWDPMFGTIFGIIVILFGLYRLVIADMKRRRASSE